MPLKNPFSRRHASPSAPKLREPSASQSPPPFVFVRSDTSSQTVIHPPTGFSESPPPAAVLTPTKSLRDKRRSLRASLLGHRRNKSIPSLNIPQDNLPKVNDGTAETEALWEHRAAALVQSPGLVPESVVLDGYAGTGNVSRSGSVRHEDDKLTDDNIQLAIQLHESGQLERSTSVFGRLADPNGANNPLAQVLYGLALRHGWGIDVDLPQALTYLQAAARNSAEVEEEALRAGMKKGGKAKGELVLAIYELGNCFRHGWGVEKDANAAREYYETAANLGDSDAQNEIAWCYVEGFGCKKDKKKAAKYYRLAEKQGNKILGNTWIYKDKYMDVD